MIYKFFDPKYNYADSIFNNADYDETKLNILSNRVIYT